MSSSARARSGPPHTAGRSKRGSESGITTRLPVREKDVVVIESDDGDVSDGGDSTYIQSQKSHTDDDDDDSIPKTPTNKNSVRTPGRIAALVRSLDTTLHTPPTLAPSSSLDGARSSKKTHGLVPRQGEPLIKDVDTSGRISLRTPSTFASSGSPHGTQSSKSRSSRKTDGLIPKKENTGTGTSRQKLNETPASAAIKSSRAALPSSSPALPPAFPLAVKSRVYSTSQPSRPSGKRNIDIGSKKLEAFGFVSAASLLAGTATRNSTAIVPIAKKQNIPATPAATVTPLPKVKPEPVSEPISKPIKREEGRILGGSRESLSRTTWNPAAAATSISASKIISKPIKQEPLQVRVSAPRQLPQTPEKPTRAKRARTPSTGTRRDPYAISSDSEDDHGNGNGNSHSCPPLRNFAKIADTHETASDVEAVLNQFPAWLDSPSPTELQSSYLSTPRSTTPSRLGKRLWGEEVGNRGRAGREDRRVRFCAGDGFTTSPVPAKRTPVSSYPTSSDEDRVMSSVKRNASLTREPPSSSPLASFVDRTRSPIRRVTPLRRAASLIGKPPSTQRDAFSQHQLTPTQQTASLDNCGPSPSATKPNTRRVEITIPDSESESESSDDPHEDMNPNLDLDHDTDEHRNISIQQPESISLKIPRKAGLKKKTAQRKRKARDAARRHRNRDRETWRMGKRVKGEMKCRAGRE